MSEHAFGYETAAPGSRPGGARARLRLVSDRDAAYDGSRDGTDDADASMEPDGGMHGGADPTFGEADDGGPVDARVALERLREAADAVARTDLTALSHRDLLEHTVALDRQTTRLEAQRLRALARVGRVGAFTQDACVSAGSWFKLRTRRDPNRGATLGRWARRLERFDLLRHAFEAGEVTYDHVTTILRHATPRRAAAFLDHQDTLVDLARRAEPRDVKVAIKRLADAIDHRQPDGDCGPSEARELYHARSWRGLGDLRATLDPITAERFDNLLHAYSTPDPAHTPDDRRRTPAQVRHDALDAILKAAEEHPDAPSVQGATPHALVFIDLFTLLGRPDLATRTTRLGSGTDIDLADIIHLLEDAKYTAVLSMGPYRTVGFGRTRRVIPGWLRPLLAMLHGHCRGPGCDRPAAWTHAAHQKDGWADGGDTRLDATVPACPGTDGHHTLMDVAGWNVDMDRDTLICRWTSPDGTTVLYTHPPDP